MTENEEQNSTGEDEEPEVYEVTVERSVTKSLRKVDKTAATKIAAVIDGLATDPRPAGTKALTGPYSGHYRLRVNAPGGEYRVVWTVNDTAKTVTVTEAGPREGSY